MIKSFMPRASLWLGSWSSSREKRGSVGEKERGGERKNKTLDSYQFKWCVLMGDGREVAGGLLTIAWETLLETRLEWAIWLAGGLCVQCTEKKTERAFCLKHRHGSFKGSRVKRHFIEKRGVGGKEEGLGRYVKLDLSLSFLLSHNPFWKKPYSKIFPPIGFTEI